MSRHHHLPSIRRRAAAVVLAASLPLAAVTPPLATSASAASPPSSARRTCAERTLARMSLAEKVGQLFLVGVDAQPSAAQRRLLTRHHVGSVLLAHDSYAGVAATRERVARMQSLADTAGVRLWVAADQEGGYVQHLRGPGFSDIPTALVQGSWSRPTLRARARTWGDELRRAGVNLDLAPVADTVPKRLGAANMPIGYYDREYGHRSDVVAGHALAVRRGMKDAHVQTAAKHFPGLGRVRGNTDTTYGVTDDVTTRHGRHAVQPFRDLINDRIPVVMLSSARYEKIDPDHVGPLSPTLIRGMLRHDLGFTGTVVSDSLTAKALSHVPRDRRALRFLKAGGDLALVGSSGAAAGMVHAVLRYARHHPHSHLVDRAALHVLRTKNRQGLLPCSPPTTPGPAGSGSA